MSVENHQVFKGSCGGWWCTATDQVQHLQHATIPELRAIAADADLGVTVRKAAERTIRKIQKLAKAGVAA